jgi:carboxypeptidase T
VPPVRRAPALGLLALFLALTLTVPAAVPQQPGGHWDDLGVWVPDEVPSVTFLPGPDLGAYRNHSEMASYLSTLQANHPGLVDLWSVGKSVRGLDLWAVRITDEGIAGPKPKVLIDAAHHGDEVIGTEIALRLARDLTSGFAGDARIRAIVQGTEVFLVPMVNPDGVTLIPQATHYATARKNANGVDPNRNYDYHWGGAGSGGPGSDTYRGPSAFSEPETRAIRDLLVQHDFLSYVSIHSGAWMILWPWGWTTTNHHERATYDELGDQLTTLSGGVPHGQTSHILYVASGVSMDYGAGQPDKLRPFTFSPETYKGSGNAFDWWFLFNPPDANIEPTYQKWKPALLHLLETTQDYTGATWTSPDLLVNGESFFPSATLGVSGKRGFLNSSAVLHASPGLELFSAPVVGMGNVPEGGVRTPSWIVQANQEGVHHVVVRAESHEAAGNLTRVVRVEARDVVKYLEVQRPAMGAFETNGVRVTLPDFGLTGVQGRLVVKAEDGEVFFDESLAIPDGGSVVKEVLFTSGDRAPGRTILVMTFDLTGQGSEGPVARHVEQRASYTITRPDVEVKPSIPATSPLTRLTIARATMTNTGTLPAEQFVASALIPWAYATQNGQFPSPSEPLKTIAKPAPSYVLPEAGGLRVVWEGLALATGQSQAFEIRLTPLVPGAHTLEFRADYGMTQLYHPDRPAFTPLRDEATATQVVG